ncbi:MAG: NifB/NifX family molybdenum-iron cluster-binding protein [Gammaproteobacteria bacterium]|nr:NifB/NifX family molybdenum-iron cluster-binding protein [Gammaproteobacteria bacterium]
MKIAIPANDKFIAKHFGHCPIFKVFSIEDQKITAEPSIENPGNHQPGVIPLLLKHHEIDVIIAGGMGQKAINFFNDMNIKVIVGVSGLIENILNQFINGTLESGDNSCHH